MEPHRVRKGPSKGAKMHQKTSSGGPWGPAGPQRAPKWSPGRILMDLGVPPGPQNGQKTTKNSIDFPATFQIRFERFWPRPRKVGHKNEARKRAKQHIRTSLPRRNERSSLNAPRQGSALPERRVKSVLEPCFNAWRKTS